MLDKYREKLANSNEIYLRIKVLVNAGKTEIKEEMEDNTIKIAVKAVPEKGKANLELIKFLAKEFVVDKNKVKIISGAGDRLKLIKITK